MNKLLLIEFLISLFEAEVSACLSMCFVSFMLFTSVFKTEKLLSCDSD
jgi:hypothetical protein